MIKYSGDYCIERDEQGRLYKRTRKGKRFDMFPMNTAVIAYDSHSNFVIYTLMYEPLIRGKRSEFDAIKEAKAMQPDVKIEWERVRYITRCGVVVAGRPGVYRI
ncbi:hypothetical protein SPD48_14455 [Pseudogracilibacillus sp. SE30717A]|uniref:hypothetical protein n=1 Tax=Pseudogracilibacillus sp. SE30717A TaxID=3098293 RepID=UPI00300E4FA3